MMDPNGSEIVWDDPAQGTPDAPPQTRCAWGDPSLPLDQKGRLLVAVACQNCGAGLMGQPIKAKCPKCGAAVGWSARGDRLNYADPRWLNKLRSGMSLLLLGVLGYVGLLAAAVVINVVAQAVSMPPSASGRSSPRSAEPVTFEAALQQSVGPPEVAAGPMVIALLGTVLMTVGVWKLTTPEPDRPGVSTSVPGAVLRWSWLLSALLANAGNVLMLIDPMTGLTVAAVNAAVSIVSTVAMLVYLRSLALRMPDDELAEKTQLLLVMSLILIFIFLAGLVFIVATTTSTGPAMNKQEAAAVFKWGVCGTCVSAVAMVILTVAWVMLLFRYKGRLADAYRTALRMKTVRQ